MHVRSLWFASLTNPIAHFPGRLLRRALLRASAGLLICGHAVAAAPAPPFLYVQPTGKAPSSHVGSAMAVLATLEQARVLPPEGTREANRIIQSVIQFQSAFTTGEDPAIWEFASRAVAARQSTSPADVLHEARREGWTAELLVALSDAESRASPDELEKLQAGLNRYNMSVVDFTSFMDLVRRARVSLTRHGFDFTQTFAAHRSAMPGTKP